MDREKIKEVFIQIIIISLIILALLIIFLGGSIIKHPGKRIYP